MPAKSIGRKLALLAALTCFCFVSSVEARQPAKEGSERWFQEKFAADVNGEMEVKVANGRVDVVTETHAIEVEFASKWKESVGQSLWYAMQTNKRAGVVLIVRNLNDFNNAIRLESLIASQNLPIDVWRVDGDGKIIE